MMHHVSSINAKLRSAQEISVESPELTGELPQKTPLKIVMFLASTSVKALTMKIAIAQVFHEGNDFNCNPTELEDFERQGILVGADLLRRIPADSELAGFTDFANQSSDKITVVPLIRAIALPSGRVSRAAYDRLHGRLISMIDRYRDLDGVFLSLHGAMVVEGVDDSEGEILADVREALGADIPIVASLDLHANLTDKMISNSSMLIGYRTSPHEDMREVGFRAASALVRIILNPGVSLSCRWKKLPMISPTEKHVTSGAGPYASMYEFLARRSSELGLESSSLFTVTPWLDIPDLGFSVVAYGEHESAAERLVEEVSALAWSLRRELLVDKLPLEVGVESALSRKTSPVLLVHGSDSTLAGAPGDNTTVLGALIGVKARAPVLAAITDSVAVEQLSRLSPGDDTTVDIGGRRDRLFCKPLRVSGILVRVIDATAEVEGPVLRGLKIHMGKCAVLRTDDLWIVVTEHVFPGHDPSVFRSVGLVPEDAQAIVVNSTIHYRSNYRHIAREEVLLDAPGASSSNLASLPFSRLPASLFPVNSLE